MTQPQGLFSYLLTPEELGNISLTEDAIVLPPDHPRCRMESPGDRTYQWVYLPQKIEGRLAVQQPDQWLKGDRYGLYEGKTLSHYILDSNSLITGVVYLFLAVGIRQTPTENFYEAHIFEEESPRIIHAQTRVRLEEAVEDFDQFLNDFKQMHLFEVQCSTI